MIDKTAFQKTIKAALDEDLRQGDITSNLLISKGMQAELKFVAREDTLVCGSFMAQMVYEQLGDVDSIIQISEGSLARKSEVIATSKGDAHSLLLGERVVLNLMQRMCGVANATKQYVDAVFGTKATILDTRKTMPGLRVVDKYSVTIGGGENHRMCLDDMVLIKDNHIILCGGVVPAINKAKEGLADKAGVKIVVECDTKEQALQAIEAAPDRLLLDNMTPEQLREIVDEVDGKIPLEASGGVCLDTVKNIALSGVDYISVGAITHSVIAADIGADLEVLL